MRLESDVTVAQLRVLLVPHTDGPSRMGAIASATGVALSTATGIVDHLVKKGLVLRDADPQDRRLVMNILCLGAVFAVLLLVYRRLPRALFIILPVGLVIGWASLAMYVGGLALNPLTAVLGLIVVGIGTEFMVLLTSRYEEEKQKGEPPRCAMVIASSRMGRAIVTTGLTTLAGFGVLVASNFVMIRDFGVVTIIGVFLCLVSTIVVMPPLMVWFDERSSRKRLSKQ